MMVYVEGNNLTEIVSWVLNGRAILVHDADRIVELLSLFFDQTKYRSFSRQMNMWDFKRLVDGPCKGAFLHPYFCRHDKALSLQMHRQTVRHRRGPACENGAVDIQQKQEQVKQHPMKSFLPTPGPTNLSSRHGLPPRMDEKVWCLPSSDDMMRLLEPTPIREVARSPTLLHSFPLEQISSSFTQMVNVPDSVLNTRSTTQLVQDTNQPADTTYREQPFVRNCDYEAVSCANDEFYNYTIYRSLSKDVRGGFRKDGITMEKLAPVVPGLGCTESRVEEKIDINRFEAFLDDERGIFGLGGGETRGLPPSLSASTESSCGFLGMSDNVVFHKEVDLFEPAAFWPTGFSFSGMQS